MNTATRPPIRGDRAGDGHYGAKRGDHTHRGVDLAMLPGTLILAPEDGRMGDYGQAYASTKHYRIVDFIGKSGTRYRYFYAVQCGYRRRDDRVAAGQPVAMAQDITTHYLGSGMTPHIHLEIFNPDGERVNPETYKI